MDWTTMLAFLIQLSSGTHITGTQVSLSTKNLKCAMLIVSKHGFAWWHDFVFIMSVSNNGAFTSNLLIPIKLGGERTAQAIMDGFVKLFTMQAWTTGWQSWCSCPQMGFLSVLVCTRAFCQNLRTARNRLIARFLTVRHTQLLHCQATAVLFTKGEAKNTAMLKKLCWEIGIASYQMIRFEKWNIVEHINTISSYSNEPGKSDNLGFLCCLAIATFWIPHLTRFRRKLTSGECKDELMVAIGEFTILLDGERATGHTLFQMLILTGTNLLKGLTEEFEIRYDFLWTWSFFF